MSWKDRGKDRGRDGVEVKTDKRKVKKRREFKCGVQGCHIERGRANSLFKPL